MKRFSKIICIVLDGVGVGESPDAASYGDTGSNSLANVARHVGSLRLPSLERMGLGNVIPIEGVPPHANPTGCYGHMRPASAGKDSTTGHWELMGCVPEEPFPTYPQGFPDDVIERFEKAIGRRILGNKTASGTEIINELGEQHLKTSRPIVYTSQDSVFQIATHESISSTGELYEYCKIARAILAPPHGVARVIARPFAGDPGRFYRTPHRRDFSQPPPVPTVLDALTVSGRRVVTIGKISDLFAGRGITSSIRTKSNQDGMQTTIRENQKGDWALIFTNLVDFDTMWGHRNDARAYALGLEEFDSCLIELLPVLDAKTLLVITSDHGNDPTTPSTDHSRENVPLLVYCRGLKKGIDLGVRRTFADVGKTIAENFELDIDVPGESFLELL